MNPVKCLLCLILMLIPAVLVAQVAPAPAPSIGMPDPAWEAPTSTVSVPVVADVCTPAQVTVCGPTACSPITVRQSNVVAIPVALRSRVRVVAREYVVREPIAIRPVRSVLLLPCRALATRRTAVGVGAVTTPCAPAKSVTMEGRPRKHKEKSKTKVVDR